MSKQIYFLTLCLGLLLFTCKTESKITFSDINITSDNNKIVEVNIPEAKGSEQVAHLINSEIKKTILTAIHIGDADTINSKSIKERISSFNIEFETFKTDFPESAAFWEAQIDGEVIFQSVEIISIAITTYINTGGAHGALNITFLNFEAETGKLIPNDKLFKDIEAFKKIAETYFEEALKDKDLIFDKIDFELPSNMAYNDEGIILLYNTYEIAPYSSGIIEFTIPFYDVESLLVFNGF